MAPASVILIRHAQSESNLNGGQTHLPDPPLTAAGLQQCRDLNKTLQERNITADVTLISPILRTLTTALVGVGGIKDESNLSRMGRVTIVPELQETGNVPSDTPRNTDANLQTLRHQFAKPDDFFDAWDITETNRSSSDWQHNRGLFEHAVGPLKERAEYARQYFAKQEGRVIVVSHGAFIRYMLGLEVNVEDEWQQGYYFNNCEAREYKLQNGKLIDEQVVHKGAAKQKDKEQGFVTE